MKYKVGDKVKLKSKEGLEEIERQLKGMAFNPEVYDFAGSECTICNVVDGGYIFDLSPWVWSENMIEGLVEEPTTFNGKEVLLKLADIELPSGTTNIWECPEGYIFKDENGNVINATKIVLEKKKKEYPKTYEECCEILQYNKNLKVYPPFNADIPNYDALHLFDLLEALRKLIICRDAYWKIAGEEMGLGKPWKPDYDSGVNKYGIICMNGVVQESNPTTNWERHLNKVLDFPTKEMRDAFYENFKELIESVKELV